MIYTPVSHVQRNYVRRETIYLRPVPQGTVQ